MKKHFTLMLLLAVIMLTASCKDDEEEIKAKYTTEIELGKGIKPEGKGTKENPYLIKKAEHLRWMKKQHEYGGEGSDGKHYKLMTDMEVTASTWWAIEDFKGVFDGNGHKITGNLAASYLSQNGFGFVGSIGNNGTIKNLHMNANVYSLHSGYVGAIAGRIMDANEEEGEFTISDCTNSGKIVGKKQVGGIVGNTSIFKSGSLDQYNVISNCINKGLVVGQSCVGGIIGGITLVPSNHYINTVFLIWHCQNEGEVTAIEKAASGTGGIIGDARITEGYIIVKGCTNKGTVKSEGEVATGIQGDDWNYLGTIVGYVAEMGLGGLSIR